MSNDPIHRWTTAIQANPANHLARFSLAKALFDQEQFTDAKIHLREALNARPDWMVVLILLGKCDLALGDKRAAMVNFEAARQLALAQNHEGPLAEMESLLADLRQE